MTKKKHDGNIIWLASYPKSGNTWLRIFFNNLLSNKSEPININELNETDLGSSGRIGFDSLVGVDSADLTQREIDFYLPKVHKHYSRSLTENKFVKTHDALTQNDVGEWIIPKEATYKAIYLIRNPLDVCVSFAHHSGFENFDLAIKHLASEEALLGYSYKSQMNQLHQYLGSWSGHVKSWLKFPSEKLLVVRFEDLKLSPQKTFSKIVKHLNLKSSQELITQAIDRSKISKLQKMEDEQGFNEKLPNSERFFRKGKIGSWRDELTAEQAEKIINNHKEMMIKFNYLDLQGNLKV